MLRWIVIGAAICLLLAASWSLSHFAGSLGKPSEEADLPSTTLADPPASSSGEQPANEADGLNKEDYRQAVQTFRHLYPNRVPTREDLLSVAGELAVADGRVEDASRYFAEIPTEHPVYGLPARLQQGLALLELNRASEAEGNLRLFLQGARVAHQVRAEDVIYAFKWLNYILSVTLRLEARKQLLEEVHQVGLADLLDSKQYLFPNLLILNSPNGRARASQFAEAEPDNDIAQIAVARYKTMNGEYDSARDMLRSIKRESTTLNSAISRMVDAAILEAFYDGGMAEEFDSMVAGLAEYSADEPWLLTRFRAEYALQRKNYEHAIRYFSAVLEEDPANARAQMGLAETLKALDRTEEHAEALKKSAVLAKIRSHLPAVQPDSLESVQTLSSLCEEMNFVAAAQIFRKHAEALQQHSNAPAKQTAN